jgi:hypothetical protein
MSDVDLGSLLDALDQERARAGGAVRAAALAAERAFDLEQEIAALRAENFTLRQQVAGLLQGLRDTEESNDQDTATTALENEE